MSCKGVPYLAALTLTVSLVCTKPLASQGGDGAKDFGQFRVDVYPGRIKIPPGFHKDGDGLWVDESGKPASAPHVNFAGEYYLAAHSCGTCCRYYTLDDLRTGGSVDQVGMFDASDGAPHITKDGHTYVPILFFKPDSRLLIVQYELDLCTPAEQGRCRERYFVFENGRFRPISSTLLACTRVGKEPE
jgi:hypothetical protein